jgi:L-asparagine transporter-like permease
MYFGIIFIYILLGFLTFFMCKAIEDDYSHSKSYKKFSNKPKFFKGIIRFSWFIFWPLIVIGVIILLIIKFILTFIYLLIE